MLNKYPAFKLKKTILSIFFISLTFQFFSQQVEQDKIYFTSAEKTRGTFQIEVSEEKYCNMNVTGEMMEEIEKNRKTLDFSFIYYSKYCRIRIFPSSMIPELRKNPIDPCIIIKDFEIEN
jgi:hypothetical protein